MSKKCLNEVGAQIKLDGLWRGYGALNVDKFEAAIVCVS